MHAPSSFVVGSIGVFAVWGGDFYVIGGVWCILWAKTLFCFFVVVFICWMSTLGEEVMWQVGGVGRPILWWRFSLLGSMVFGVVVAIFDATSFLLNPQPVW